MKTFRKVLRIILLCLLAALFLLLLVRIYVCVRESSNCKKTAADAPQNTTLIVLGAGVYRDGSLSPILKNRLDRTLLSYREGEADTVLVTGDHREGEYDEVDHMCDYLMENGIPEDAILKDYSGYSTYESIYRAAYLFGVQDAVIVTQQYHLYRALYIGEHCNMQVRGAAAENAGSFLGRTRRSIREVLATTKDVWNCLLQTEVGLSVE